MATAGDGMSDNSLYNADLEGERSNPRALVIDISELDAVRNLAREWDIRVERFVSASLEPLSTITVVLFGTTAATAAMIQALERIRGGQIIDLRNGAAQEIYRSRDLTYGTIVIFAADGQMTVSIVEPRKIFGKAIEKLPGIISATGSAKRSDLMAAIQEEFGDSASVDIKSTSLPE